MGADSESSTWLWNGSQRRVLVGFLLILCPVLAIRYACNQTFVSDPQPTRGPRYDEVVDKINPNVADVATLSALPMIGDKRAQDIIDYRESRRSKSPGEVPLSRVEDLLHIRGFGRASIETMRPYLMFPATTQPSTQP